MARRFVLVPLVLALPAQAQAAVTLGQLAEQRNEACASNNDANFVQATTGAGINPYAAPSEV